MNSSPLYQDVRELIQRFEAKDIPNIALDIAEIWSDINAKAKSPHSDTSNTRLLRELYMQRIAPYWTFLE